VPGHPFAVAGHFAEKVRPPGDHILAQQVFDDRDQAPVREQVVDVTVLEVSRAYGITVAAGGKDASQECIEVAAVGLGLLLVENAEALEESVTVELFDLPRVKVFGFWLVQL